MTIFAKGFLSGPEVWIGSELKEKQDFIQYFNTEEVAELDAMLACLSEKNVPDTEIDIASLNLNRLTERGSAIREQLEGGRGFALIRGLPVERWTKEDARKVFWVISSKVGEPLGQDQKGNKIHEVTNTGLKVETSTEVRSFQTDDELTFHNDGGDAFMLLCRKQAKNGGMSKLVSVGTLYNEVLKRRPDLIDILQQPFYFDTRGQHPLGLKVQVSPIFNFFDGKLSMLYKRRYMFLAQNFPEVPRLSTKQKEAVELLEELTNDPDMQLNFYMQPGDIQLANNYSVLHARSSYEDYEEIGERRHLFRSWLTLSNGRKLPPEFEMTREFRGSYLSRKHTIECENA